MSENARHRNSTAKGRMTSSEMYLNLKRTKLLDKSNRFSLNHGNYLKFVWGEKLHNLSWQVLKSCHVAIATIVAIHELRFSNLTDTQMHDKDEPQSRSPTSVSGWMWIWMGYGPISRCFPFLWQFNCTASDFCFLPRSVSSPPPLSPHCRLQPYGHVRSIFSGFPLRNVNKSEIYICTDIVTLVGSIVEILFSPAPFIYFYIFCCFGLLLNWSNESV